MSVSGHTSGGNDNELSPLEAARREKMRRLEELGIDPWGHRFDGHQAIAAIRARENEIEAVHPGG